MSVLGGVWGDVTCVWRLEFQKPSLFFGSFFRAPAAVAAYAVGTPVGFCVLRSCLSLWFGFLVFPMSLQKSIGASCFGGAGLKVVSSLSGNFKTSCG